MAYYHCLLMDLDGTLLDFDGAEAAALQDTLAHFEFADVAAATQRYHEINKELWAALERGEAKQEKIVVQRFNQLMMAFSIRGDAAKINEYYLNSLSQHAVLYPHVAETLHELAEVATLAVVTNGIERVQLRRLESAEIGQYFDGVFVSGRMGVAKPSRKMFDMALRTLGVEDKEKVLMIGDSLRADIVGGANAGIATCWCNFNGQDLPTEGPKPTFVVNNIKELLTIVMETEELDNVGNPQKRHQI